MRKESSFYLYGFVDYGLMYAHLNGKLTECALCSFMGVGKTMAAFEITAFRSIQHGNVLTAATSDKFSSISGTTDFA